MRVLLDTHTFLWWAEDSPKLSDKARKVIQAPEHRCVVSLVCAWEMAVKASIGKARADETADVGPVHNRTCHTSRIGISRLSGCQRL